MLGWALKTQSPPKQKKNKVANGGKFLVLRDVPVVNTDVKQTQHDPFTTLPHASLFSQHDVLIRSANKSTMP